MLERRDEIASVALDGGKLTERARFLNLTAHVAAHGYRLEGDMDPARTKSMRVMCEPGATTCGADLPAGRSRVGPAAARVSRYPRRACPPTTTSSPCSLRTSAEWRPRRLGTSCSFAGSDAATYARRGVLGSRCQPGVVRPHRSQCSATELLRQTICSECPPMRHWSRFTTFGISFSLIGFHRITTRTCVIE